MKVLFVGSNPSQASKSELPFYGDTRSDKIVFSWINRLPDNCSWRLCNVADFKTENNRPLTLTEIKKSLPELSSKIGNAHKIVALGKTAARALTLLHVDFYEMPHPSGANRKLNNKTYVEEKINGLLDYLQEPV
jgi:uracil-DNA glycosylase